MFDTPYKVISEDDRCKVDGGFCIEKPTLDNTEEEVKRDCVTSGDVERINLAASSKYLEIDTTSSVCKNKGLKTCCYSKYECLSKGGICKTDANRPDANEYTEYNEWKCPPEPSGLNCYIKEENYYSYGDYIQSFGGEGIVMISANIIPGETYAISFGSPTETCGWCGTLIKIGAITGGIAGIAIGAALAPASFGTSLTAAVAGAGLITGATGAAYLAQVTAAGIENLKEKFGSRNFPTVYLTTLNQITEGEELCKRIESL